MTATTTKDTTTRPPTNDMSFETAFHKSRPIALADTNALIAFERAVFFLEHSLITPFGIKKHPGGHRLGLGSLRVSEGRASDNKSCT